MLSHQSDPGRAGRRLHAGRKDLAGGGWRGQAVTAVLGQWRQAEWAGLEAPAPPQLLGFSLQPLPPGPGVPCHGQARPGVPHSRGTDQGGEKVKKDKH